MRNDIQDAVEEALKRDEERKSTDLAKGCGYLFLGIVALSVIITTCVLVTTAGNGEPSSLPISPQPTSRPIQATPTPADQVVQNTPRSIVSVDETVIETAKAYPEVVDAAISRDGRRVSLVLVVRSATSTAQAKTLGENFVRLYKSMSDDDPPGKSVGAGQYDYLIGVYYPNEKQVAFGGKVSFAEHISW